MKVPIILWMKLYVFMVNSSTVILTMHTGRWQNMSIPRYVNHRYPQFSINVNKCTPSVPIKKSFYGSDFVPERMSPSCCGEREKLSEREKLLERGNKLLLRERGRERKAAMEAVRERK
jgi:hypothetical protein